MQTQLNCGTLAVSVYKTRTEMGMAAAAAGVAALTRALAVKENISVMFAAAPSQAELLCALLTADVDWGRVDAYHMDDYVGLPEGDGRRFPNFLRTRLFEKLPFRSVNCMRATKDLAQGEQEADRYDSLLRAHPMDVCFMGIGENGHIAFNDPAVADFNDARWVKTVELDQVCRGQQVNDGCFETLEQVPTHAMTVTIPALCAAREIICVVPGPTKANAVGRVLSGAVSTTCPASILTTHPAARLFLDSDSAALVS